MYISIYAITRGNDTHEKWIDKGVTKHNKLVPVEGGQGIQSQASHATGNCSELDILRGNPSDPVKVRHRLQDVVGEPEIDEHGCEAVYEPPHPGGCPTIHDIAGLGVEGAVEGNSC